MISLKTLLFLITATVAMAANTGPPKTYQEAAKLANQQHKKLFVLFHKSDCPWCDKMFEDTMGKKEIRQFLGKYFI